MSVIRWEEPPPHMATGRPTKSSKFAPLAKPLRKRPMRWALLIELPTRQAASLAYKIKQGKSGFEPAGAFDAVSRRTDGDPDTSRVYARYVGGDS